MIAAWRRAAPPAVALESASRTHLGRVRAINEDRVFVSDAARCWAVADGMGGYRGGDVAAQAVVDALRALAGDAGEASAARLCAALQRANAAINAQNVARGQSAGATVVAAVIDDGLLHVAWCGDSRAYRVRNGTVEQLTHDHSVVQELIDAGALTPAAAADHPHANVVTRALGIDATARIDVATSEVAAGDLYLLCSDGLSRSLDPARVAWTQPAAALADALLRDALARDGSDNISLVLLSCA